MMLFRRSFELALSAAFALVLAGCTSGDSEFTEVSHDEPEVAHDHHGDHGHGHHGPNGGEIVEVGNEEFHAEVVVDEESHQVDVYILGSDASTAKPIEASEISISFRHGDEVEEFKLAAAALDGEPEGQSSRFTLSSDELFDELHEHSEGATLSFSAGGETLSGTVTHSHDHDHGHAHGHGHAEDDHHEHASDKSHGDSHEHAEKPTEKDAGSDESDAKDNSHSESDGSKEASEASAEEEQVTDEAAAQ